MAVTINGSGITSANIADGTITASDVDSSKIVTKDSSGNVGIGVTPQDKLQVDGSILCRGNGPAGTLHGIRLLTGDSSENGGEIHVLNHNGEVAGLIDLVDGADPGDGYGVLRFLNLRGNVHIGTTSSYPVTFETGGTERMRIDASGYAMFDKRVSAKVQDIFHVGGEDWCDHGRYAFPSATHVSSTSPYYSGAKVTGSHNYYPDVFIPYSIGTVMKLAVSIYCLTNDSTYGNTKYYAGCIGYDKDFNFMNVDGIGTYQYNLMSSLYFSAGERRERDVTLKGWQGSGGTNTSKMDEGTVYIRPMLLCNYQRGSATSVVEGFTMMPAGTVADGDSNAGTNF